MYLGVILIIVGIALKIWGGSITKKFIYANNHSARTYSPKELKAEWNKVAAKGGVVPSWVSLVTLGAWVISIAGIVVIIRDIV